LWYAGLSVAALLTHWAMGAESAVFSAGLAAAAIAIPLLLLGHTMRSYSAVLNSHVLVPAIGPIVIAVLIVEYIEYNKHLEDAQSAELIPAELVVLSDVKWSAAGEAGGRLSGHVVNRSPHELVGLSIEMVLYGGSEELSRTRAQAEIDVDPGQEGDFTAATSRPHLADVSLPCTRADPLLPAPPKNAAGQLQCFFQVTATRGREVFF